MICPRCGAEVETLPRSSHPTRIVSGNQELDEDDPLNIEAEEIRALWTCNRCGYEWSTPLDAIDVVTAEDDG